MLARAGVPVTLIGRPHHIDAISRHGLRLESLNFQEHIPVAVSVDVAGAREADVVLFCVKTVDNEETAMSLARHLTPGAVVMSFQNGVDNVERIRAAAGIDAVPTAVYVAAAMAGPGHVRHTGRGDLVIGHPRGGAQVDLNALVGLFAHAGVPCVISANIEAELWTKMSLNCAYNAISALGRAKYGRVAQSPWVREILRLAVEETVAVAGAAGVRLSADALIAGAFKLSQAMPEATSSTAQDIERGKRTEIDSLNGYIARRGAELGIPTPVNQTLHALVKLLEEPFSPETTGHGVLPSTAAGK
jgi:2-dehydropantoate 2-reductase